MNTQSQLKIYKSGEYSYLYIYFKSGENLLRISTKFQPINGKMTKELLFSSRVEDYELKNQKILEIKAAIDAYIMIKQQEVSPSYSQKELKHFLKHDFKKRTDLYVGKPYVPSVVMAKENKRLTDYFDDYINYRKNKATPRNTLKEFTTVKNRIFEFDKHNGKNTLLSDINILWSDSFEGYLRNTANNGTGYKTGTIEKTYTILKTVLFHFYERKDELKINLADKFKSKAFKRGEKSRNDANPLTKSQFEALFKHDFKQKHLNETKDRFCLQCSTGLRFGDLFSIDQNNINDNRIILIPSKTQRYNKKVYIPLNQYSKSILEKYKYNSLILKIGNQPYNRNLKAMFKSLKDAYPDLEYRTDYGSHNGRDTFISICVQNGVDFKTILEWVGQSSYAIMDRYIKTTDEHKNKQMGNAFG